MASVFQEVTFKQIYIVLLLIYLVYATVATFWIRSNHKKYFVESSNILFRIYVLQSVCHYAKVGCWPRAITF